MSFRWIGKSADGKTVTLKRLEDTSIQKPAYATEEWINANSEQIRNGAIIDIETTGLNQYEDVIIELAIKQFIFNGSTGEILDTVRSFESFQDPGRPIPVKITNITGITDEMVIGKKIDWNTVNTILADCSLVIAHNARFDRPFIDKKATISNDKIWACTFKQIDWETKGFHSSKLELLNIYHGFFTDSHRAMNDVDALLYLLGQKDATTDKPYLFELITNARRPMTQMIASSAPFATKDRLKERSYNWDNSNRFWSKIIFKDDLDEEIRWMESEIYSGAFAGLTRDIALNDSFKN